MKMTKVAAKKFMIVFSIALIISLSIPHVSLWGFGAGVEDVKAEVGSDTACTNKGNEYSCQTIPKTGGYFTRNLCSGTAVRQCFKTDSSITNCETCRTKNYKWCYSGSLTHGYCASDSCISTYQEATSCTAAGQQQQQQNPTNCQNCHDIGHIWCANINNPKDSVGVCIKPGTRCPEGDTAKPYTKYYYPGSKCPEATEPPPVTGTQTPIDHTKTTCENCFLRRQKFCKTIQTNVNFGYNYAPGGCISLNQKCNDFREKEITNSQDCPPATTCGSICLNQMFYSGASYLYGSSQQLSMPMGQCSEGVPLYMLGNIMGQQSASAYQQIPQLVGGQYTSADVGCNPNQQCYCIRINMQNFQQSSAATNYPSATIPGRTQTANWKNPREKKNPPRTAIDNYNGIATSGRITAKVEHELFQAGDKITIKGSVDKMCSTCDGWKYTCEAFNELPCKVKDKLLGFQLKYEYPKCPADIPDMLHEEGEETFTKLKKVLDAALAIYMIKEGGLFGGSGSGSSSIMNNPYMLQIIAQQSGANINPYMLSIIMQSMQTTGRVVGDESLLPVTGMATTSMATAVIDGHECNPENNEKFVCNSADENIYICKKNEWKLSSYINDYLICRNNCYVLKNRCVHYTESSPQIPAAGEAGGATQTLQPGQFRYQDKIYTVQSDGTVKREDGIIYKRDAQDYFYDRNDNGQRNSGESMSSTFNTLAANARTTEETSGYTPTLSFFRSCNDCLSRNGIWCTPTEQFSEQNGKCYSFGCPSTEYAHTKCSNDSQGVKNVAAETAKSAEESKGMSFQQIMLLYFVFRMLVQDPPTDHVCYRVCGEQYDTQAGKAPVCSRMISTVSGVSEVVIGYQNATYTCQQGYCGKWANKDIKIEIYSPTRNFITAYTTKTDGIGGFSYTFAAPHVDGEFTAVVSIPGAGLSQATQNIPGMIF